MTASPCFRVLGILVMAGLSWAATVQPGWLEGMGIEIATAPSNSYSRLQFEPGPECEITRQRSAAKRRVIASLEAGELTLFEAAAWFGDLNREPAEYPNLGYQQLPGRTDEEKLCRQVIHWAHNQGVLKSPSSEIDLYIGCLEAELAAHMGNDGRIDLPRLR